MLSKIIGKVKMMMFPIFILIIGLGSGYSMNSEKPGKIKKTGHFTLWQLPSQVDNIGNSYVLKTGKGHIIVMDGGEVREAGYLREFIKQVGNGEVEAWFISHPHADHIGAITSILGDPQGIKIKTIYHSRFSEKMIAGNDDMTRKFYGYLDNLNPGITHVVDLRTPGSEIKIDGVRFKILGVTNEEITENTYNNSSMVIRVWDKKKSVVFLADAGEECGDKVLAAYRNDLDCDYLQVSHHGQHGCRESFYKSIKFKACLWPTPSWVWDPRQGSRLTTMETRRWMEEIGIAEHYVSCRDGLVKLE